MLPSFNHDIQLLRRAQAGDRRSFTQLAEQHQRRLYRLCHRLQAGDRPAAEDLAQDALLRWYRNLDKLDASRPIWPWLRRLTLNLYLNQSRTRQVDTSPLEHGHREYPVQPDHQLESSKDGLDQRIDLDRSLRLLSAADRSVLVLHYLESLSYKEMSALLGLPVSTIESRLFRARKRMAAMLQRLDPPAERRPNPGVEHVTPLDG